MQGRLLILVTLLLAVGCAQKTPPPAAPPVEESRPDEVLGAEVRRRLNAGAAGEFGGVVVVVTGSEVTLRGSVSSVMAAWRAEAAARSVAGVRVVRNELLVRAQGF